MCDEPADGWKKASGNSLYNFNFSVPNTGLLRTNNDVNMDSSPLPFYKQFVTDEMVDNIVNQTNLYVEQTIINKIAAEIPILENSFLAVWKNTTRNEIWNFIALLLWIGLNQKPSFHDYWCKSPLYSNPKIINASNISRTRFQSLLSSLHFANNEDMQNRDDRLYKLNPLLDALRSNFQKFVVPQQKVCIDESMIGFKGRLKFRQYIKNKRHRYGIKVYKLCLSGGYTYNFQVYVGKDTEVKGEAASNVVLKLMEPLPEEGRIVFTDNFYTSVSLAEKLLSKKIFLVGTLRKNRKGNPKHVIKKKLKKGNLVVREKKGVMIAKWKDKRDAIFLSTFSKPVLEEVTHKKLKPNTIIEYNQAKGFVDLSDQMTSYGNLFRKTLKWYHKVAFDFILNVAVVNAYGYYKEITKKRLTITQFREMIVADLLNLDLEEEFTIDDKVHKLVPISSIMRCKPCYKQISHSQDRETAIKQGKRIKTKCNKCNEAMCLTCFNAHVR